MHAQKYRRHFNWDTVCMASTCTSQFDAGLIIIITRSHGSVRVL